MTDATKKKAIEKLSHFRVQIGYPDKWMNLDSAVTVDENISLRKNIENINLILAKENVEKRFGKKVDKDEWYMTPQTVNAYYNPASNGITFPAAILQAPFFDPDADDAANYGAIGTVIGHEMSHGFDDQGCQYDKDGNLHNWWTAEDKKSFDERAKGARRLVLTAGGRAGTEGERREDSRREHRRQRRPERVVPRLQNATAKHPLEKRDGFTPEQRFFIAYGRIWASNIAPQFIAYLVNSDVHSPNRQRVNAALPMIDAWYDAFGIKQGDKLYVPADKRAHIW